LSAIEVRSGNIVQVAKGSINAAVANEFGALVTQPAGGALQRAALEGRLFVAANQAAVAVTAGLAGTWTGLGLANPADSGKIIIVHRFGWALSAAASAATTVGLMTSTASGFAAAITARNCFYGASNALTAVGYVDDGASIATPVAERWYGEVGTLATTGNPLSGGVHEVDLSGQIILGENRSVMTCCLAAATAAFLFHFVWEEIDK
jgi:hypothetical protein